MVDILLLAEDEDGVVALIAAAAAVRMGVKRPLVASDLSSFVGVGKLSFDERSLDGGCKDLVLSALEFAAPKLSESFLVAERNRR